MARGLGKEASYLAAMVLQPKALLVLLALVVSAHAQYTNGGYSTGSSTQVRSCLLPCGWLLSHMQLFCELNATQSALTGKYEGSVGSQLSALQSAKDECLEILLFKQVPSYL